MTDAYKVLLDNIVEVKRLKEEDGLTHLEVAQRFSSDEIPITALQVGNFCRENRIISLGTRIANKGDRNPCRRPEVRNKISNTISQLWSDGIYDERVNGMLDKRGMLNPRFNIRTFSKWKYKDKYHFYNKDKPLVCERCGKPLENIKYDIHHIDEDHDNYLTTNLQMLCVPCHQKFHLRKYKQPFITISRKFLLEASHFLPEYEGKCFWLHGHRYEVEISVKRRIDPETGMVLDFHKFKDIVEEHLVYNFDHAMLNDFLINPTSERFLVLMWKVLSPHLKGMCQIQLHESRDTVLTITDKYILDLVNTGQLEAEWLSQYNENDVNEYNKTEVDNNESS